MQATQASALAHPGVSLYTARAPPSPHPGIRGTPAQEQWACLRVHPIARHSSQRASVAASAAPGVSWPATRGVSIADDDAELPSAQRDSPYGDAGAERRARKKTKVVATIGPTSNTRESLFALADAGMDVVRLNMSHGDHASHRAVVDLVREYNAIAAGRGALAVMLDTKGPEVRSGDLPEPRPLAPGDEVTFTTTEGAADGKVGVNYDGFTEDVSVGDTLLVDGGIISLEVRAVRGPDVVCEVLDGGVLGSRRHLNIRGKTANLPAITERDWADIQFGVDADVDFFALSFVRDAAVIHELKAFLQAQGRTGTRAIGVLAKIESADSVQNLEEILDAVDGAMVARGDLGAELPVEEVPFWQSKVVQGCRRRGIPCIVATNMLESMIQHPTPTRAEVSDIAVAVREGADAVMLSGETAYGAFPLKALDVMCTVARRTEAAMSRYSGERRYGSDEAPPIGWINAPARRPGAAAALAARELSEVVAYHAVHLADAMAAPLVVFSRRGHMPALLSHYRPMRDVFCFTDDEHVQRRLALYRGVFPLLMPFSEGAEATFDAAVGELKHRGLVHAGQLLALVQSGLQPIWRSASTHGIQVRTVPQDPKGESTDDEA